MNGELQGMVLLRMENNMKLALDNMYSNNKQQQLLLYLATKVMMTNMEYSLVLLEYKIVLDQMVMLMMLDMDRVCFENLEQVEMREFDILFYMLFVRHHQGKKERKCHHSGNRTLVVKC